MKKKILAVSFLLFIFWYGTALSKEVYHYTVTGEVNTINLSESIQQGTIHLKLCDGDACNEDSTNTVFDETGILIGIVTGSDETYVYLTHMAIFEDGSMFVTDGDKAWFTGTVYDNGSCSITELISNIVIGRGFFKKINDANVTATGTVDYYTNKNEFLLDGDLGFK